MSLVAKLKVLSDFTLIQRLGSGLAVAKLNIFAIHSVMPCVLSSHCNKILNISNYHRRHEKFEPLKYRKNEGSKATVHDLVFDVQTEKLREDVKSHGGREERSHGGREPP